MSNLDLDLDGDRSNVELDDYVDIDNYNPPQMAQMSVESPRGAGFVVTPRETQMAEGTPRDTTVSRNARLTGRF